MDFKQEPKLMEMMYRGVLFKTSHEYKLFQVNLQKIIQKNLEETGYDPINNRPLESYQKFKKAST